VRTVTLPILAPSVASAAFLAFITSFDELVVAMFISGANMTLPKKMYDTILAEIEPTVAAVSVLQIILISGLLILSARLRRAGAPPLAR
jgi:putative spermidine/putrescine transport system permease protein